MWHDTGAITSHAFEAFEAFDALEPDNHAVARFRRLSVSAGLKACAP
jgi:hypothetical protein